MARLVDDDTYICRLPTDIVHVDCRTAICQRVCRGRRCDGKHCHTVLYSRCRLPICVISTVDISPIDISTVDISTVDISTVDSGVVDSAAADADDSAGGGARDVADGVRLVDRGRAGLDGSGTGSGRVTGRGRRRLRADINDRHKARVRGRAGTVVDTTPVRGAAVRHVTSYCSVETIIYHSTYDRHLCQCRLS